MTKKLLGGALSAVSATLDVARHVAWFLSHQVGGHPRPREDDEPAPEEDRV
jgi:hypothetical protein